MTDADIRYRFIKRLFSEHLKAWHPDTNKTPNAERMTRMLIDGLNKLERVYKEVKDEENNLDYLGGGDAGTHSKTI